MAVQPFKGSDREFWDQNGWAFVVHAQAGRWELREFVDHRPVQWMIASTISLLAAEATVRHTDGGWSVHGTRQPVPAHTPFRTPIEAFRWWISQQAAN